MDIRTGYSDRTIFMTGGTGFVGKVALYKILKEFPDVRTVYLLMRGKKSRRYKRYLNPQERLELEVMGSPCFEPIRKEVGDARWKELCGKVKAMNGDITEDHIGLSEQDRATFAREVQMIIHMAATVNFNERLDLAVQMNTLGGLRVLSLAKTCQKLEAMVHVSTCYVNYRRQGKDNVNEEQIYPIGCDPEEMCKAVLGIHPSEVEAESARLLKAYNFANTYTFTKNLGEQLLQKYKADVPLSIVRPAIIGCSYAEPFPGWVDALTAAGGLILTGTLGVIREFECQRDMVADIIPVDHVVNVILKALFVRQQHQLLVMRRQQHNSGDATASSSSSNNNTSHSSGDEKSLLIPSGQFAAPSAGKGSLTVPATTTVEATTETAQEAVSPAAAAVVAMDGIVAPPFIYQVATSGTNNTVTWSRLCEAAYHYMRSAKRHPKAVGPCEVVLTPSRAYYTVRYNLLRYAPYLALKLAMQLPEPIGSEKKRELVEKYGKAVRRADMLNSEFHDFVMTEWYFTNENARKLDAQLDARSVKALAADPYAINWFSYTHLYTYGIFKHIVRETGDFKCPTVPPSASDLFARAASL